MGYRDDDSDMGQDPDWTKFIFIITLIGIGLLVLATEIVK